jgi:WD40 repeat protein
MRVMPRTVRGTWLLAVAAWVGLCAAGWWVTPEQMNRRAVTTGGDLFEAVFGPENRWLAARAQGPWMFWDTTTGQPVDVFAGDAPECGRLLTSPNGKWVLIQPGGRNGRTAAIWSAQSGKTAAEVQLSEPMAWDHVCFGPAGATGELLACREWDDGNVCVRLLDLPSLRQVKTLKHAAGPIAFSRDGRFVATGDSTSDSTGAAVWDVATGRAITRVGAKATGIDTSTWTLAFSPTGDRLVLSRVRHMTVGASVPAGAKIIDLPNGAVRAEWPEAQIVGVENHIGTAIVGEEDTTRERRGWLRGYDVNSGVQRFEIPVRLGFPDAFRAMVGGQLIAVTEEFESPFDRLMKWLSARLSAVPANIGPGMSVAIYDAATGEYRCRIVDVDLHRTTLVSPDGRMLAVQKSDSTIEFYDLPPRKPLTWFAAAAGSLALLVLIPTRWRTRRLAACLTGAAVRRNLTMGSETQP